MRLTPSGPALHPEVAAVTERYRPSTAGIGRERFERLTNVANDALVGLDPVVVVNRRVDSAQRLLSRSADEPFDTIHTATPSGPVAVARRAARMLTERLHGTHGTGADAGRTVFGSTRFVPVEDAVEGADAVLQALQRQGAVGVEAYGPVAFVVDPESTWNRTTFAARDTAVGFVRVTHGSKLGPVVAERIVRGAPGAPAPDELLQAPHEDAVLRVRDWLTSDALADERGYIEAQVRSLRPRDVAGVHVATTPPATTGALRTIDPGPRADEAAVAQLLDAARKHGWAAATR